MNALASQRCFVHSLREAVARCPECTQFYCRECITEHDDRIICATCLRRLAQRENVPRRRPFALAFPLLQAFGGLLLAWLIFYFLGQQLLEVPADFHASKLWKFDPFSLDE